MRKKIGRNEEEKRLVRGRREADRPGRKRDRSEQQRGSTEAEKRENRGRERPAIAAVGTMHSRLVFDLEEQKKYKKQVLKLKVKAAETKLCK
jgi:hypothetical protein